MVGIIGSSPVLNFPASSGISKGLGSTPNILDVTSSVTCWGLRPGIKLSPMVGRFATPETISLPASRQLTGSGGTICR